MSGNTGAPLRPLLPASSMDLYQELHMAEKVQKRRKVACVPCQQKRVKVRSQVSILYCTYRPQCVGSSPCQECAASESQCILDPCKDKRHKIAWKDTQESLIRLITVLRHGTYDDVQHLRQNIQQAASPQHAVECLHLFLSRYEIDFLCRSI